ncbi:hypothetical protein GOBAR_AA09604 [Gossypium barbadense]|uniref:Uncharacterized protein n=1 Tax=Gossypium barbadense TaxID=3634 RepID=A0A2P5Y632_GOSBA|nr:hypothetical protein GOBAR_AA09604 [Gossypium barbadense]
MMKLEEDTPVVVEVGSTTTVSSEEFIVVVRQDMAAIENLFHAQRCQSMKPPHELDDGWVVAEMVGPCVMKGHHQECPLGPPTRLIGRGGTEKVPCQSSHIGTNGDDSSPMPLRLMANGEGNKIGTLNWGKTTKMELDRSRITKLRHNYLEVESQTEFEFELKELGPKYVEKFLLRSQGKLENGCLISEVGPEDDAAPFLFFVAWDIDGGVVVGVRAWQEGRVKELKRLR